MTPLVLYVLRRSAPSRAALFTLHVLRETTSLDVEIRDVSLRKGEHLTAEYLALNPLHTVPTLERSGDGLRESRAIMRYLCGLTSAQSLYPEHPWARAQIDALLDWDASTLYPAVSEIVYPQVFRDVTPNDAANRRVKEALDFLEAMLADGRPRLTGERLTLADISIMVGVTMLELVTMRPFHEHRRLEDWVLRLREHPGWATTCAPFEAWKREYAYG